MKRPYLELWDKDQSPTVLDREKLKARKVELEPKESAYALA